MLRSMTLFAMIRFLEGCSDIPQLANHMNMVLAAREQGLAKMFGDGRSSTIST